MSLASSPELKTEYSYDVPPPGGESLEMTAARTLPYFKEKILPDVMAGKNVIVAAHGNSLR